MKIFLISDIHFEFHNNVDWLPPLPDVNQFDVLVLAGDIGMGPGWLQACADCVDIFLLNLLCMWLGTMSTTEEMSRDRQSVILVLKIFTI